MVEFNYFVCLSFGLYWLCTYKSLLETFREHMRCQGLRVGPQSEGKWPTHCIISLASELFNLLLFFIYLKPLTFNYYPQ